MTWKVDENGNLVLNNGNPVYVDSNGQEKSIEPGTITRLNAEARTHREAKEALEAKLISFKDIDPGKAKEAIDKLSKIDQKLLIDSGKVDELKNQITQQFTQTLTEKENALKQAESKINDMLIDQVFSSSQFVRDGIVIPVDVFKASYRNHFKVEEGKIQAVDRAGNPVWSAKRAGEHADPEEALQILVNAHPQKELILKANTGSGSGNDGGGGNRGGLRSMAMSEFTKLQTSNPAEASVIAAKIGKKEMVLTD